MSCPGCGLINPRNALWCDCDYDFAKGAVSPHVRHESDGRLCPECGLVMTERALWCFCGHDFRYSRTPSFQSDALLVTNGGTRSALAWFGFLLRHAAAGLRLARMNAAQSG